LVCEGLTQVGFQHAWRKSGYYAVV